MVVLVVVVVMEEEEEVGIDPPTRQLYWLYSLASRSKRSVLAIYYLHRFIPSI